MRDEGRIGDDNCIIGVRDKPCWANYRNPISGGSSGIQGSQAGRLDAGRQIFKSRDGAKILLLSQYFKYLEYC